MFKISILKSSLITFSFLSFNFSFKAALLEDVTHLIESLTTDDVFSWKFCINILRNILRNIYHLLEDR